jgi:hypothetical protein
MARANDMDTMYALMSVVTVSERVKGFDALAIIQSLLSEQINASRRTRTSRKCYPGFITSTVMFGPQVVVLFDIPLRENSGILAVRSAA